MSNARNEVEQGRWISADKLQNPPECIYTGGAILPPQVFVYERRDIYNPVNGPARGFPETGYRLMPVPMYCDRGGFVSVKTNPGLPVEFGGYAPKAASEPFVDRKDSKYAPQSEIKGRRISVSPNNNAFDVIEQQNEPAKVKLEQLPGYNKSPQTRFPIEEYYRVPNYSFVERQAAPNFAPPYYLVPPRVQPYSTYGDNCKQMLPSEDRNGPPTETSFSYYNNPQGPVEYVYMQNVMPIMEQQHMQNRQFQSSRDEFTQVQHVPHHRRPGEEAEVPGLLLGNSNEMSFRDNDKSQSFKDQDRPASKPEYLCLKNETDNMGKSKAGANERNDGRDAVVEMYGIRESENGYFEPSSRVEYIYLPTKVGDPPNPYYNHMCPVKTEPIETWPLMQTHYDEPKHEYRIGGIPQNVNDIGTRHDELKKSDNGLDRIEFYNVKPSNRSSPERRLSPSIKSPKSDGKQEQWKMTKTLMSRERAIRDSAVRLLSDVSKSSKLSTSPLEIRTYFKKSKKASIDRSAQTSASFLLKACQKKRHGSVTKADRGFHCNIVKSSNRTPEQRSPSNPLSQVTTSTDHETFQVLKKTFAVYPEVAVKHESKDIRSLSVHQKPPEPTTYKQEISSIHKLLQELRTTDENKICAELKIHPAPMLSQLSETPCTGFLKHPNVYPTIESQPRPLIFTASKTAAFGHDEVPTAQRPKNEDRRVCESIRPLELINPSDVLTAYNSRKLSPSPAEGGKKRSAWRAANAKSGWKSSYKRNGLVKPGGPCNWQCFMMNGQDLDSDELNNSDFRKVRKIVINYAAKPTGEVVETKTKTKKSIDVPAVVEAELRELKSQLTDLSQWVKQNSTEQAKQTTDGTKSSKWNWLKRSPITPDPEDWLIM